jgi:mono/diheme cytochrome c family protein
MMASKALRILVPGLLLPAFMGHAGGWAVITVDELPDHVEVGKPVSLTYMVRQHGVEPHDGLRGSIEATSGRTTVKGTVRSDGRRKGQYAALLTLPNAGEWTVTIRSGFGPSDVTLLPVPAVAPGAALTRAVSDAQRGQHLFVAKGCVTCHVQHPVGPRLDGRRFDATYLAGYLANPTPIAREPGKPRMPNLELDQREIASLVAYLNSATQLGAR